jgi:hypothetical protein
MPAATIASVVITTATINDIVAIMKTYELFLSDRFNKYITYSNFVCIDDVLKSFARAILYIFQKESEETKITQILNIFENYEKYLTNGYHKYNHHYYNNYFNISAKGLQIIIAKEILHVITKQIKFKKINDTKITKIIGILKNYEDNLSDGFRYYLSEEYDEVDDVLKTIATKILENI